MADHGATGSVPIPQGTDEPNVLRVAINICRPCLAGVGEECHTPECALYMHRVDLPIYDGAYEVLPAVGAPDEPSDDDLTDALTDLTQRLDLATNHTAESGATLLVALYFPGLDPETTDPDALADEVAGNCGSSVEVNGIPVPQWLNPMSIAAVLDLLSMPAEVERLRAAAPASEDDEWLP